MRLALVGGDKKLSMDILIVPEMVVVALLIVMVGYVKLSQKHVMLEDGSVLHVR